MSNKKSMNKNWLIILLLLLYLLYSVGRITWLYGDWQTFSGKYPEYLIEYPAHWTRLGPYTVGIGHKNMHDLNVAFLSGDALLLPTMIKVRIHYKPLENGSLQEVVDWGEMLRRNTGNPYPISPLEEMDVGVGNYAASTQTFRKGLFTRIKYVYVFSGDSGYILHLTSESFMWNKALDIFEHMLASFQIVDTSE